MHSQDLPLAGWYAAMAAKIRFFVKRVLCSMAWIEQRHLLKQDTTGWRDFLM